jgi:hypothetical protein
LIQTAFTQNPLAPLLVFVRQYFGMLPNITQNATKGRNRIKPNKNGHEIVFHGREIGCGGWI